MQQAKIYVRKCALVHSAYMFVSFGLADGLHTLAHMSRQAADDQYRCRPGTISCQMCGICLDPVIRRRMNTLSKERGGALAS